MQSIAANAVNTSLTLRNWIIGYYIVEYEQKGEDRAKYGEKLLERLEEKFKSTDIKSLTARRFRDYRLLYVIYPQIRRSLSAEFIKGVLPDKFRNNIVSQYQETDNNSLPGDVLVSKLSYSHLELLIRIDNKQKRTFYEIECIKGTWSVRELKRQINSLYYERSGLSAKPELLSKNTNLKAEQYKPSDFIKNIYAFEFLDLNIKDIVEESDLEKALLDHLHNFILELGYGFCFEARQKRILIGEKYYFIDLVFYHRILKCHVLIDLKIGEFEHGDIEQLNTYLNYFKDKISEKDDNLPVGILLVAEKDKTLVKYATAGMDKNLFVQQYLIQLPSEEKLKLYIEKELRNIN